MSAKGSVCVGRKGKINPHIYSLKLSQEKNKTKKNANFASGKHRKINTKIHIPGIYIYKKNKYTYTYTVTSCLRVWLRFLA